MRRSEIGRCRSFKSGRSARSDRSARFAKKMYICYNYMTILSHTITKTLMLLYTRKVLLVNISAPSYYVFLLRD